MRLLTAGLLLACLAFLPEAARAECSNNLRFVDGNGATCVKWCECGSDPETCGCCQVSCSGGRQDEQASSEGYQGETCMARGDCSPGRILLMVALAALIVSFAL